MENGVHVMSMCRHWAGTDSHVGIDVVGAEGEIEPYRHRYEGRPASQWAHQYVQEHTDFVRSIREGSPLNEARQVAESTLTGILGREAAYTGKLITWEQMMASDLDLSPAKHESGPLPVRPVPMPGKPRKA